MPISIDDAIPRGGFVEEYMRFTEPFEFPRSFALMSLLAVASCAIEGRVLVNPNTQPSPFTNLYVLLYGPSGCRKGAAMEYAREMLAKALPDAPMLPQSGTMQGLIDELAEKTATLGRAPGMIYSEEFSDFIGGADYLQRNSQILTQLYDCRGEWTERTRQHKRISVYNPYVVLLGASNPDWFEGINPKLLTGGFLRRLLLVVEYGPRQEAHAPRVNTVLFNRLIDQFAARFEPGSFKGALMPLTVAASEADRVWYRDVVGALRKRIRSERESHFVNTMQEHSIKLGAVLQLLERTPGMPVGELEAPMLVAGQKIVLALLPGIFQAYQSLAGTGYARLRAAVIRVVRMNPEPMSVGAIDRAVTADVGARPRDVVEARESLMTDGILEFDQTGKMKVKT